MKKLAKMTKIDGEDNDKDDDEDDDDDVEGR